MDLYKEIDRADHDRKLPTIEEEDDTNIGGHSLSQQYGLDYLQIEQAPRPVGILTIRRRKVLEEKRRQYALDLSMPIEEDDITIELRELYDGIKAENYINSDSDDDE